MTRYAKTQAALAKAVGRSESTVSRAVKRETFPRCTKRGWPIDAARKFFENARPGRPGVGTSDRSLLRGVRPGGGGTSVRARRIVSDDLPSELLDLPAPNGNGAATAADRLIEATSRYREARAERERLALERERGDWLPRRDVAKLVVGQVTLLVRSLDALVARLPPMLTGLDRAAIRGVLVAEFDAMRRLLCYPLPVGEGGPTLDPDEAIARLQRGEPVEAVFERFGNGASASEVFDTEAEREDKRRDDRRAADHRRRSVARARAAQRDDTDDAEDPSREMDDETDEHAEDD